MQPGNEPAWLNDFTLRLEKTERRLSEVESVSPKGVTHIGYLEDDTDDATAELLDRIAELENKWEKHESAIVDKKLGSKKNTTFKFGGRLHYDHWSFANTSNGIDAFEHPIGPMAGTDPEARWGFRRVRLEFSGDIQETMFWKLQTDFADPESTALKDAFIGFKELPYNQSVRIGHQKRPIGLDHWNSSRFNMFMERPLIVESMNEDARRLGMTVYGYTDDESFNWQYGIFQQENSPLDGKNIGDAMQYSLNARVSGTPWYDETSGGRGYFHWGTAFMAANPDGDSDALVSGANQARFRTRMSNRSSSRWMSTGRIAGAEWYEVLAFETMINVGSLQLGGEFMHTWMQRDNTTAGTGPDLNFQGYYMQASYFLTGEHIPIKRKVGSINRVKPFENFFLVDKYRGRRGHGWGAWQIAGRYGMADLSDNDIRGGVGRLATGAVNWYWTPYSRLQFNLLYGDVSDHAPVLGLTGGNSLTAGLRFAADF
ncbi:MAG: ATPase [Planctomycetaceae bacterium]|nr:ATPase [Planctomycetaceae bacterium]